MTRLIDADALNEEMYHKSFEVDDGRNVWNSGLWIRYKIFEEAIRDAPTINAVPVIRCYECRYYNGGISDPLRGPWCDFHEGVATDPNNYCSWAKKEGSVFGNGTNE